jgi:hypothetical protein
VPYGSLRVTVLELGVADALDGAREGEGVAVLDLDGPVDGGDGRAVPELGAAAGGPLGSAVLSTARAPTSSSNVRTTADCTRRR